MAALVVACGSSDAPPGSSPGGAGSGVGGSAGAAAGAAGTGTAGQAQGGSSGAASAGSGGASAGSGGASAGSGGASAACVKMGTQADPGTDGDGKMELPTPTLPSPQFYAPAPETMSHIDGAPVGKVNGVDVVVGGKYTPLVYAAKTPYPNLNKLLKYEYWIYVPAQYKPGCAAALMVFQDGIHYVGGLSDAKFNTPVVLDNLIHQGEMPVTIALFINPGEPGDTGHYDGQEYPNRSEQYDRNNENYVKFLADEFLPANVLGKYDIVTDPDGWGIGGHSSGGIAAFIAGWYRPDRFRKLLTHSASFPNTGNGGSTLLGSIDSSEKKPLRVYLMSGPKDLGGDSWFNTNTSAATKLAAKGYHYEYRTMQNSHFPPTGGQFDFANALRWMWRGYKLQ